MGEGLKGEEGSNMVLGEVYENKNEENKKEKKYTKEE